MGRKVKQLKNYTSQDVKALIDNDDKHEVGVKLCAIYQMSKGKSSRVLEDFFQVSFKQICNWADNFDKEQDLSISPVAAVSPRCRRSREQIILYVDNARLHHAKCLAGFLDAHPKLQIRFLPPYSPDLNPVERVWWFMRKYITHNRYLSSIKERRAKFWQLLSFALKPNDKLSTICVTNFYKSYNLLTVVAVTPRGADTVNLF